MAKIMVVGNEAVVAMRLEERLRFMGYEVVGKAHSGESAVEMAKDLRPDLVLLKIQKTQDG